MSLLDLLGNQIDDQTISQISSQLGIDSGTASKAIGAALPMLVSALAKNTASESGAQALGNALQAHDGNILGDLAGFLGGGNASSMGAGILKHVLGGRQNAAASAVGQASGLDLGKAAQLLMMLAPIVMGVLGKSQRQAGASTGAGGFDLGSLVGMLQGDNQRISAQPQGSVLNSILDRDGDGQIGDDLANLGMSVLGGLLGGKR
jgi:hypothetical protein